MIFILGLLIGFVTGATFIMGCYWWSHIDTASQQGVKLTTFHARFLAWLFLGFILLLAMVFATIGGN